PFFTKKDVGTGLGLWLTKQIVDAHSGKIRVRSAPGRGTVVGIYWPAAKERIAEGETFSASTQ
ncbi:MAG TPA: ATP-binding protein, partial [Terriglobales bacterium]